MPATTWRATLAERIALGPAKTSVNAILVDRVDDVPAARRSRIA